MEAGPSGGLLVATFTNYFAEDLTMPRVLPIRLHAAAVLAALVFSVAALPARADVIYNVTADLSALPANTVGNLDFELNPGSGTFDSLTATISNFTSSHVTLGAAGSDGGGSGALPGVLTIVNSGPLNDVFQAVTMGGAGSTFSFTLDLSGKAVTNPSSTATAGTAFGLGVLDASFNPFPQFANSDPVLRIDVFAKNATPSITTVVNPPITHVGPVTGVPEPSIPVLAAVGLILAGASRYLRSARKPCAAAEQG